MHLKDKKTFLQLHCHLLSQDYDRHLFVSDCSSLLWFFSGAVSIDICVDHLFENDQQISVKLITFQVYPEEVPFNKHGVN